MKKIDINGRPEDLINTRYVFIAFILSFKKYRMNSFVIFERDINK